MGLYCGVLGGFVRVKRYIILPEYSRGLPAVISGQIYRVCSVLMLVWEAVGSSKWHLRYLRDHNKTQTRIRYAKRRGVKVELKPKAKCPQRAIVL